MLKLAGIEHPEWIKDTGTAVKAAPERNRTFKG